MFKIAETLGKTVAELKQTLTYKEFCEWGAYFSVERANYSQTDVNIAQMALLMNNYLCRSKIKLKDVLPQARKKKMTNEEGCLQLKTLFTALQRAK